MRRWQPLIELLFYHTPMADPLGSELPLGCSRGLPLAMWRFPLLWFWSAEDRAVLGSISWQSGFPLFVLGHFFLLGMGLGLNMKWTGVPRSFGPTLLICINLLFMTNIISTFLRKKKNYCSFAVFFKSHFDEHVIAWYKTLGTQSVPATLNWYACVSLCLWW